jgi:hypothetical protein
LEKYNTLDFSEKNNDMVFDLQLRGFQNHGWNWRIHLFSDPTAQK